MADERALTDLRILIVDDSKESIDLLENFLKRLGFNAVYNCDEARKAQQILIRNLANNTDIDLVLVDWNMPKVSGLEFLKRIRANLDLKELPFIMVTGDSNPENVKLAIEAGVNNYIVKPVDKESLFQKIEATMKGRIKKKRTIL